MPSLKGGDESENGHISGGTGDSPHRAKSFGAHAFGCLLSPKSPRLATIATAMRVLDALIDSMNRRAALRVIYRGGSQPGAEREIVPRRVTSSEVIALDVASGLEKTFSVGRIELPREGAAAPRYQADGARGPTSIFDAMQIHVPELERLGWHVERSGTSVSLHRFFKNGKPRKGYEVLLSWDPITAEVFDDFDGKGEQWIERPSPRPYHLSGVGLVSRAFGNLSRAVMLFMDQARLKSPTSDLHAGIPGQTSGECS